MWSAALSRMRAPQACLLLSPPACFFFLFCCDQLGKEQLLDALRFGADQVFRSKDTSITDADIDAIMAHGKASIKSFSLLFSVLLTSASPVLGLCSPAPRSMLITCFSHYSVG